MASLEHGGRLRVSEVLAANRWGTNAALIVDVARLGYLDGSVLDVTYGEKGGFWKEWRPAGLVTSDLHHPADHAWDYRNLPCEDRAFDAVVFDPPYRLSGRRDQGEKDRRFGLCEYRSNDAICADLIAGAVECFRVAAKYLLVKCQNQVNGGRVRWQTDFIGDAVKGLGGRKVDEFVFLTNPQPQPDGRQQLTARRNYSTLLVFAKAR